ncbi:unnamed protein product (macronuclear) [Paramecium tetraurelia]|uniref:Transmembrane protein n=1 Tax=Paramecium tetraurelia TaxID=5888 RepID=A0E8E6_PARTE|nr:uncharacterized protein GSPATT00024292001 [Paramecium tetraurelia]CAK91563.1 unnamed protein product [Paramecium tetraurelia]|eukprot:XP_001458960.1 hypothetical protein (macronuclear) [Paramecium tetraurelia strain d4-2]
MINFIFLQVHSIYQAVNVSAIIYNHFDIINTIKLRILCYHLRCFLLLQQCSQNNLVYSIHTITQHFTNWLISKRSRTYFHDLKLKLYLQNEYDRFIHHQVKLKQSLEQITSGLSLKANEFLDPCSYNSNDNLIGNNLQLMVIRVNLSGCIQKSSKIIIIYNYMHQLL